MSSLSYYKSLIAMRQTKCIKCKHYQPKQVNSQTVHTCTLFNFVFDNDNTLYNASTLYCRKNEQICGPYAKYYEEK
jgi:hypothetical protein